jgi:hypothetical protein
MLAVAGTDYRFANVLSSSVGTAPALVKLAGTESFTSDSVDGAICPVLSFPAAGGLKLATSGVLSTTYSIVLLARLDTTTSYVRLLDFKTASTDYGLYNLSGNLTFYNSVSPTGSGVPIGTTSYAQIVLTRSASGTVAGYVNGVAQFSFSDSSQDAVVSAANELRLFKDDGAENSSGKIARLRLYTTALTAIARWARSPWRSHPATRACCPPAAWCSAEPAPAAA